MSRKITIGSHVSMKAPNYLVGSIEEAITYNANAFMIYTGAPQNTIRKPIKDLKLSEFHQKLEENNIKIQNVIVHAPYIINLANSIKESTFELGVEFLRKEILRCEELGIKILVLHPGAAVGASNEAALNQLVKGLDAACIENQTVKIALETMAGKGSEVGINFQQLAYVINNVKNKDLIGVCWDTCHLYDAGYDLVNNLENIINEFDSLIGLEKLLVMHINDSKFGFESHKDRHENFGLGYIGFDALLKIIYHEAFVDKVKILESPWVNGKAPYKIEIEMIDKKVFLQQQLLDLKEEN